MGAIAKDENRMSDVISRGDKKRDDYILIIDFCTKI
jgi:hypothetical protein